MTDIDRFDQLPLSPPMLEAIAALDYQEPTDVQAGVIPLVLAGIDLIVQSQTGTGKTAAFAIPIAELIDLDPGVVQAAVLAPTRELALQVSDEFRRVGCDRRGLQVVTVYGGASINEQIRLVKKAEVVVATPGRMLDLLRRKAFTLDALKVFVLDEADEMLSMGFEKEVKAICEYLPEERQSLMFSATVTESIRDIGAHILSYPEFVSFSSDRVAADEVDHYYYMVQGVGRLRDLQRVLTYEEPEAAIIFCNTRDDTFRVANTLKRVGYSADVLNGDLPQAEREQVMDQMKRGTLRFLVATDIAARGIDVSFLPCVINFTLPESADSYIHRTGRTGRAGRQGEAVSLISPKEIGMFYQLRRAYHLDLKPRSLPSDEDLVALKQRRGLERLLEGLDADEDLDYGRFLTFADSFGELPDSRKRLAKLMAFFVNARDERQREAAERRKEQERRERDADAKAKSSPAKQASAPAADEPSQPEPEPEPEPATTAPAEPEPRPRGRSKGRRSNRRGRGARETTNGNRAAAVEAAKPMAQIRVNLGREQIESPDRLLALLADLSGLGTEDLGVATIFDDYALVEVRDDLADDIVLAIDHERLGDHEITASR